MDYIRSFDIRLDKDVYYAGETLSGHVVLENVENIKIKGIRVILRGKAHAEWKIMKSGERRTVRDDQYLLDDKTVIWGKDKHEDEGSLPILHRGIHQLPFHFNFPQTALPCSFESKAGTIRYYVKVIIDIPYSCPPQGMKYFTIIGPHIDCMEEKYLSPMVGQDKKTMCCLCCQRGPVGLHVTLERTAYVCGEYLRLHTQVENQSDQSTNVKIRLVQYVEYFIDKGVLGVNKHLSYTVLEHHSPRVEPFNRGKYDSTLEQPIKLPVVPPTLIGVCRLIQIYYVLKVSLELERSGEDLVMDFPFTVATVPYRIPNSANPQRVEYDFCSSHVEGGMYISPEFQLGQVYDGTVFEEENVLLYRPVYVRVPLRTDKSKCKQLAKPAGQVPNTSSIHVANTQEKSADNVQTKKADISKQVEDVAPATCSRPTGSDIDVTTPLVASNITNLTDKDRYLKDPPITSEKEVSPSPRTKVIGGVAILDKSSVIGTEIHSVRKYTHSTQPSPQVKSRSRIPSTNDNPVSARSEDPNILSGNLTAVTLNDNNNFTPQRSEIDTLQSGASDNYLAKSNVLHESGKSECINGAYSCDRTVFPTIEPTTPPKQHFCSIQNENQNESSGSNISTREKGSNLTTVTVDLHNNTEYI